MEYSDILRYYLKKCNITQAELARRIGGTSRSTIGELMSGRSKTPSVYKAKAIAEALGVSLDEMIDMLVHDTVPDVEPKRSDKE